jgi:hypothetical protein
LDYVPLSPRRVKPAGQPAGGRPRKPSPAGQHRWPFRPM